jgi:hypothetical protein
MTKKKYRCYSPEFKRHALKRACEDGVTDIEVCDDPAPDAGGRFSITSAPNVPDYG